MSKLPQTDELPHADEEVEPARIEEALATFADRVRELEAVASDLRAELQSLRAERAVAHRGESEDWPAEAGVAGPALPSADWVATVPPPLSRSLTVPRLAVEAAFLLLVALLAGLADLDVAWIVLVMAAAWTLVVLAEWAAAAQRARWQLDEIAPPAAMAATEAADSTGPWDMPVIEATAIESEASESSESSESQTIMTRLPSKPEEPEPEESAEVEQELEQPLEQPAKRRFALRRRKQPAETGAADPWEA